MNARSGGLLLASVVVVVAAGTAGGLLAVAPAGVPGLVARREVVIGLGEAGGFVVRGQPTFLIALSNPPPLTGRAPSGGRGLEEVADAGVNLFRIGPKWAPWTWRWTAQALRWDRAAMALGVHTWVRLNAYAAEQPYWRGAARLASFVHVLTTGPSAPGLGMWQGADEPLSRRIPPHDLAFPYCRVTSRGDPSACAGFPGLDPYHVWATILAPQGTPARLAPYGRVTDTLGVDVYPVGLASRGDPNLHQVGLWTRTIDRVMPSHSVWTTLQICFSGAFDRGTGAFVLPTFAQERYMVYDAIINGARGLGFYGGNNPHCWTTLDRRYQWNWTFWNQTLQPLIEQISAHSPLGPALANPTSTTLLHTNDPSTEAISRLALTATGPKLWVLAARSGPGRRRVAISTLPRTIHWGGVYGEHRAIAVEQGAITDTFTHWQVHIYELPLPKPKSPSGLPQPASVQQQHA